MICNNLYCVLKTSVSFDFPKLASLTFDGLLYIFNCNLLFLITSIVLFVWWLIFVIFLIFFDKIFSKITSFTYSNKIEIIWTTIPALLLLGLASPSLSLFYSSISKILVKNTKNLKLLISYTFIFKNFFRIQNYRLKHFSLFFKKKHNNLLNCRFFSTGEKKPKNPAANIISVKDIFPNTEFVGNVKRLTIDHLKTPNESVYWANFAACQHELFEPQAGINPRFLMIHDCNFYVNVSVWFENEAQIQKILNSNFFKKFVILHEQKFGPKTCDYWYSLWGVLYVHPALAPIFASVAHNSVHSKVFPSSFIKTAKYPNFWVNDINPAFFEKHYSELLSFLNLVPIQTTGFFEIQIENKNYQIPNFEFGVVNFLKSEFETGYWLNFEFRSSIVIFRSGKIVTYKDWNVKNLYIGIFSHEVLKSKLEKFKESYSSDFELCYVIKFNGDGIGQIHHFYDDLLRKLQAQQKIDKSFKTNRSDGISGFQNIQNEQLQKWLLTRYYYGSHFCSLCPKKYIDRFNSTK